MKINDTEIGPGEPPYIIGEISCNHCGSLDKAIALIDAAKYAGASAVKFQCYEPGDLTLDCDKPDFTIQSGPWTGRRLYELYSVAQTPRAWFPPLFNHARFIGIDMFASVFSAAAVDFLEKLGCPAYKIASFEIVDIPLIKYAAKTGKPLIISTGMASDNEIFDAVEAADPKGARRNIAFLSCISGYPSEVSDGNLQQLNFLQQYTFRSGISDHTLGWEIPVAATAMGAQIIEKHLCLSRSDPTEDAGFSLEPDEFRDMCKSVRSIWKAMQPSEAKSEESSRQLRRSLYVVEDMKRGDKFTEQNVRSIRPGYGMLPKFLPRVLGKTAICDLERGTPLTALLTASLIDWG